MIVCRELTRYYGDFLAVERLDLELAKGDLFGFVGPNGAGKTTTMKILATLLTPTSGVATVGGFDVARDPRAVRRIVGYMPDFFGVYREMRVAEYLAFFASAYRIKKKQRVRVVGDLLELVDLSHKTDELVGALSRGMQQRLGLARALVHDPQVLILDEPASGLDPRARVEMREVLRELRNMGKTILLSSHILPELAGICSRVGIIARGQLLVVGTLDEVGERVAPRRAELRVHLDAQQGEEPDRAAWAAGLGAALDSPVQLDEAGLIFIPLTEERSMVEISRAVVDRGGVVEHLRAVTPSLEEMFLALTEEHELGAEARAAVAEGHAEAGVELPTAMEASDEELAAGEPVEPPEDFDQGADDTKGGSA